MRLVSFGGTLIVVSHDRHFLDRVVTSTLVFEGDGSVKRYAGGYSDWARLQHTLAAPDDRKGARQPDATGPAVSETVKPRRAKKLSYKLRRELDSLPDKIERLEREIASRQEEINAPDFYAQPHEEVRDRLHDLAVMQRDLEAVIDRWTELENQAPPGPKVDTAG